MQTDDYLSDYACLGLQPGCSLETLERTWRIAVRDLHPDRSAASSDAEGRIRRLHEVTGAYRRLRGFAREHGRLPGGVMTSTPGPACSGTLGSVVPADVEPMEPIEGPGAITWGSSKLASSHDRPRWGAGMGALLFGTGLVVLWSLFAASPSSESDDEGTDHAPQLALAETSGRGLTGPKDTQLRIGSTEAQVATLLGEPLVVQVDLWEYGPSHIRFERGRVVGWYSSPLKPLPVDVESR